MFNTTPHTSYTLTLFISFSGAIRADTIKMLHTRIQSDSPRATADKNIQLKIWCSSVTETPNGDMPAGARNAIFISVDEPYVSRAHIDESRWSEYWQTHTLMSRSMSNCTEWYIELDPVPISRQSNVITAVRLSITRTLICDRLRRLLGWMNVNVNLHQWNRHRFIFVRECIVIWQ